MRNLLAHPFSFHVFLFYGIYFTIEEVCGWPFILHQNALKARLTCTIDLLKTFKPKILTSPFIYFFMQGPCKHLVLNELIEKGSFMYLKRFFCKMDKIQAVFLYTLLYILYSHTKKDHAYAAASLKETVHVHIFCKRIFCSAVAHTVEEQCETNTLSLSLSPTTHLKLCPQ